jgi:hypothetical protein
MLIAVDGCNVGVTIEPWKHERLPVALTTIRSRSIFLSAEDGTELTIGDSCMRRPRFRVAESLANGMRCLAMLLVAFLAANGFWAFVRPELFCLSNTLEAYWRQH